jgi:signal transduction histidine kinase
MAMRWPLRNQVLVPMACLIVGTLAGVSAINAYLSLRHTRIQIATDLRQLAVTLSDSNFPLNDSVLRDMQGLSGAEFVLTSGRGRMLASSAQHLVTANLPDERPEVIAVDSAFGEPMVIANRQYFHVAMDVRGAGATGEESVLHILYPKEAYDEAWRVAVYPPILLGVLAVVLVVAVARGIASRVTRPLRVLQSQVDEIAEGNFRPLPAPPRDDEVADLSHCINRMSEMLARYEDKVRHNERLRTLGQLGGGIAHQMRNAVTGCRMAVDLHARNCQSGEDDQAIQVAIRQLELMERHLQRFLALGRREPKPHVKIDLLHVVQNVIALVDANARHLGVDLNHNVPDDPVYVCGDEDALAQLLTNLALNAIEAASTPADSAGDGLTASSVGTDRAPDSRREVTLLLHATGQRASLTVQDTGDGPSRDVGERLFEPFVTEKPDGTGLGLFVAREIARSHQGEIHWERRGATTCFMVDLPLLETE